MGCKHIIWLTRVRFTRHCGHPRAIYLSPACDSQIVVTRVQFTRHCGHPRANHLSPVCNSRVIVVTRVRFICHPRAGRSSKMPDLIAW